MESLPKVVIIDLGSQYTSVIERTIRELGVRSAIFNDRKKARDWLKHHPVSAVIYSGGDRSVYDKGSPEPPTETLDLAAPVLGICYGMQWTAHHFGGKVERTGGEYGEGEIVQTADSVLFHGTDQTLQVWNSHGDSVTSVPEGYRVTARSSNGGIAAMEDANGTIFGVQFHPEVVHTPEGKSILSNFLFRIAKCRKDWQATSIIADARKDLGAGITSGERAIMGYSGGVDSSVAAALAAPVFGENLLLVTIDGGHLRENEGEEIRRNAQATGCANHLVIDAREEFQEILTYGKLKGESFYLLKKAWTRFRGMVGKWLGVETACTDAETKRLRFKRVYVALLKKAAQQFGASIILQGTLATDRIESGATGGALIKSHHNVGLDFGKLKQLHPLQHFFKYEVRGLAADLGLPREIAERSPFPGPGGFLRVNGIPATQACLDLWKWAQARVDEILIRRGLYDAISQLVVSVNGVKTVGVKGDGRVYAHAIVVRGIETIDFMTGKGVRLPTEAKQEIEAVLTAHPQVVCVYYNETSKPPATTEPE